MIITLFAATVDTACFAARLLLRLSALDHRVEPVVVHPPVTGARAVPSVEIDGAVHSGRGAVLLAIAARVPEQQWDVPPARPWLEFAGDGLQPLRQARLDAMLGAGAHPADLSAAHRGLLVLEDELVDRRLAGLDWLATDDRPSLADVAVYPDVVLSRDAGIEHHEFPATRAWLRRMRLLAPDVAMPGVLDPV